jgi:plasmid stabilization system protein ParE
MSYRFHPDAAIELDQAAEFYKQQAGTSIARAFLKEIDRAVNVLVAHPNFGTPAPDGMRAYPLRRFPYSLIYFADGYVIEIFVVAHQHRKPGYWQGRR